MKNRFVNIVFSIVSMCGIFLSCTEEEPVQTDTLSVSLSSINFRASGNEDVTVTVKTNASEWNFTATDWIEAVKEGSTLVVNCSDNTSEEQRSGEISLTAGSAKPVKITVNQKAGEGQVELEGEMVNLICSSGEPLVSVKDQTEATVSVTVTLDAPAMDDVSVEIFLDNDYLADYNAAHEYEQVQLFGSERITLPSELQITIPAGRSESDPVEIGLDVSSMKLKDRYLVPVYLKSVSNAAVTEEKCRVDIIVTRPIPIKNVVAFEVNDCNPLNALEYVLEDGTPFFDAVVLFSANIVSYGGGAPQLYNNPNVQALLDESETYLQPLRDAGIKVYLGLLGHHTAAGLCNLTDAGARQFATEVAEACNIYGLDGVFLDDEYTIYGGSNEWLLGDRSPAAGARLCYELKKAMKERCPWDTDVAVFVFGSLAGELPTVTDEGVEYPQSYFIDSLHPAYGVPSRPYGDLTNAQCCFDGVECNKGNTITEAECREGVEKGYGYFFWFAFDPSGTGTVSNNLDRSFAQFQILSRACYGQEILYPKNSYSKIGEGKYDPTPHPIS